MDGADVLKSIHKFITDIIPKAYCFQNWSKETIKTAYQWALFCEKIYEKFSNQPNAEKLDELVRNISKTVNSNEETAIGLEGLKHAVQLLNKAFIQNPHVDIRTVQTLLKDLKLERSFNVQIEDTDALNSMCHELMESLKPSSPDVGKSLYHEIKAELLLEFIQRSTSHMTSEDEVEKFLSSTMESMCMDEDKVLIFLTMLSCGSSHSSKETEEIREFCLNWMLLKIASDEKCPLVGILWKQPPKMMLSLAAQSTTFYNYYVGQLSKFIDSLKVADEDKWRNEVICSGVIKIDFDNILSHLKVLLNDEGKFSESTKKLMESKISSSDDNFVWKKVYSLVS